MLSARRTVLVLAVAVLVACGARPQRFQAADPPGGAQRMHAASIACRPGKTWDACQRAAWAPYRRPEFR